MVDYSESIQLHRWMFESPDHLARCRSRANYQARVFLEDSSSSATTTTNLPVYHFACERPVTNLESVSYYDQQGALKNSKGHEYLTPKEEATLVDFYASKLPSLIGPHALLHRLRRESKVLGTAETLYRRFFLSNSVMIHDPKAIMVAAAFLASKVEDCTADIRYFEEGTAAMNAAVLAPEIIHAEVVLISGVHFDLLCFHPFKSVLALTEDLRTFGKTQAGSFPDLPDLKSMYDSARRILDDVIVSDIPLLFTPGQIGLACLDVAASDARETHMNNREQTSNGIMMTYIELRFPNTSEQAQHPHDLLRSIIQKLKIMLSELVEGKHGCGNYHTDLVQLKVIHKKLKKVRAWGRSSSSSQKTTNASTTTKKRDAAVAALAEAENTSNETTEKSPKRVRIDTTSSKKDGIF